MVQKQISLLKESHEKRWPRYNTLGTKTNQMVTVCPDDTETEATVSFPHSYSAYIEY